LQRFVSAVPAGTPVPIDVPGVTPQLMRMFLGFCYAGAGGGVAKLRHIP
jgi:hypothetical protein